MKNGFKNLITIGALSMAGMYGCKSNLPVVPEVPDRELIDQYVSEKETDKLTSEEIKAMPLTDVLEKVAEKVKDEGLNGPRVGSDDYMISLSDNMHGYGFGVADFKGKDAMIYLFVSEAKEEADLIFLDVKPYGSLDGVIYQRNDIGGEFSSEGDKGLHKHIMDNELTPQYDSLARISLMHLEGLRDQGLEDTVVFNQKILSKSGWLEEYSNKVEW